MMLVLLGPPGAGKGTQAKNIEKKFGIDHISTGDILRSEIKKNSVLGMKVREYVENGKLVPDSLIIEIIKEVISSNGTKNGFLMDGFPRNIRQADMFSGMLDELGIKLDRVINIVVDREEIIKRLGKRRVCKLCHAVSSVNNGEDSAICPKCGGELIKRKDDNGEIIRRRLEVYEEETSPLIEYYRKKGILLNIDGSGTEEEVTGRIFESL
ncbi:MAG: adenylate kinase [Actinobacteria bacterium]|nr:adenylate kinase [Actinomycetota bacterium]